MSSTTRIGTTVAGYRLEKLLGRGGMSVVYLAEHVRLGRKVALKLLSPALSEDESFRERFERESRRAAEIDHPNIVPIYDAGDAEGQFFIAMRYVRGADLKTSIKNEGRLSVGRTLYILEQAASALDAAHELDLVHRDVKPANIMLAADGSAVLGDFGLAKGLAYTMLTKPGQVLGTLDYLAPELIRGEPAGPMSDLYAFGCVIFECIAGAPPFAGRGLLRIGMAHLQEEPGDPGSARADLPPAVSWTVRQALAKDPSRRPPTATAFTRMLRLAATDNRA